MKIELQAGAFARALSLATAAVRGGKGSPVHLIAAENNVRVRCTDWAGIGTIACQASGAIIDTGEIAVAGDRLAELVWNLRPDAKATIVSTATCAEISCGSNRSRLPIIPVANLPAAICIQNEIPPIQISAADCLRLLEPVVVADRETSRHFLNGILWHSVADRLISVASDGARLIRTSIAAGEFSIDRSCIVPIAAVAALKKMLVQAKADRVLIRRSQGLIEFNTRNFCFVSRLIDATYPDYERIIPAPAADTASCDRAELLSAVVRLAAVATSEAPLVGLRWSDGDHLDLFLARQPNDGIDTIGAKPHGSAQVAVPIRQLIEILKEFNCERILIETSNEQPILLHGDGEKLGLIARATWNFATMEVAAATA
jgi:DNA polymerase-3 subunit beta